MAKGMERELPRMAGISDSVNNWHMKNCSSLSLHLLCNLKHFRGAVGKLSWKSLLVYLPCF